MLYNFCKLQGGDIMSILNYDFEERKKECQKLETERNYAKFKNNLREEGLVPILRDGKIIVYEVVGTEKLDELISNFEENMFDIYSVVVLDNERFRSDLCRSSYIPSFRNMIKYRPSTKEEIWENFNLNDEKCKNDFLLKNAREVEVHIPVAEKMYTKGYKIEEIDEVIERITSNYVTCIYKRPSKLSKIVSFINLENFIDLDYIAELIYGFLYDKKISFRTRTNILPSENLELAQITFTDKEKSLTEEEKIAIIRDIISAFSVECVYSEDVDKVSKFQLENIFGTKSREFVIDFARHNTDLLDNSEFTDTYHKIMHSKSKTL